MAEARATTGPLQKRIRTTKGNPKVTERRRRPTDTRDPNASRHRPVSREQPHGLGVTVDFQTSSLEICPSSAADHHALATQTFKCPRSQIVVGARVQKDKYSVVTVLEHRKLTSMKWRW